MKKIPVAIIILIVFAFFALVSLNPFTKIDAGERGIVLNWGAFNGAVLEPGLHFVIPVVQTVVKTDVRTHVVEVTDAAAYSHDLQNVLIHSIANYNIDPASVGKVYQQYGRNYEVTVLYPNLQAAIKQTIAKYSAEELLSKRDEVSTAIETTYRESIPKEFILTNYALVNEQFSDLFEAAIEKKQVAQQDAERAENELKKVKIEAEQRVTQAKAEAEAIQIQAAAIEQQGGANYVQLQAIAKWDGRLPAQMVSNATLPFISLGTPNK